MAEKTMTPSADQTGMTDGQIDKATDIFRSVLRKYRSELGSDPVQQVLGMNNLGPDLFAIFRKRVEAVSNLIIRRVHVDRSRTSQEVLDATGRNKYVDDHVVELMPRGEGEEVEVAFFKINRRVSDIELKKEYETRGLVPCDPFTLAAVNEADSAFADDHPNGTHWKDEGGNWCFATFSRWSVGRYVSVNRSSSDWSGGWWFAGLRK
jgi:hypothetical protein